MFLVTINQSGSLLFGGLVLAQPHRPSSDIRVSAVAQHFPEFLQQRFRVILN